MLKVRIVNFNEKQKKESIRHARLFFEEKIFAANVYVYIYIYDIVDGQRRQTQLHGAWRHECNDIYVLRGVETGQGLAPYR